MSAHTLALEEENAQLKIALDKRNAEAAELEDKLANLSRGAGGDDWTKLNFEPAVLSGMSPSLSQALEDVQGLSQCFCRTQTHRSAPSRSQ